MTTTTHYDRISDQFYCNDENGRNLLPKRQRQPMRHRPLPGRQLISGNISGLLE